MRLRMHLVVLLSLPVAFGQDKLAAIFNAYERNSSCISLLRAGISFKITFLLLMRYH